MAQGEPGTDGSPDFTLVNVGRCKLTVSTRASNATRRQASPPFSASPRSAAPLPAKGKFSLAPRSEQAIQAIEVGHDDCGPDLPLCYAPIVDDFSTAGQGAERLDPLAVQVFFPDGSRYPGDLIDDILAYRRLRAEILSGSHQPDPHFDEIEARLRAIPRGRARCESREYHRFTLDLPAKLRFVDADGPQIIPASLKDMSAGGVRLAAATRRPAGEPVWLLLRRGNSLMVLPSRVAWSNDAFIGLMFAGAPGISPGLGR